MPVNGTDILNAVIIAFYAIAFLPALYVCLKHGWKRQLGWLEIVILAVVRIVGAVLGIVALHSNPVNQSLVATSVILSSIGLRFLFGALLGVIRRVHQGSSAKRPSDRFLHSPQIPLLVAVILSIIGGIKMSNAATINELNSGKDFLKGGAVLFLLCFLLLAATIAFILLKAGSVRAGEMRLVYACLAAPPFLLVRVIYSLALAFAPSRSSLFNFTQPDVIVQALSKFTLVVFLLTSWRNGD